jgi:hypothetical protein
LAATTWTEKTAPQEHVQSGNPKEF